MSSVNLLILEISLEGPVAWWYTSGSGNFRPCLLWLLSHMNCEKGTRRHRT